MNLQQQQSVLTIAMLAAFADGAKDDTEREEIRRIAQSLAAEGNMPDLPRLYQDVLLRRTSLESAAAALQDPPTASSPTKWPCACAMWMAARRLPSVNSWPISSRPCNWAAQPQMPLIRKNKPCSTPWTAPPTHRYQTRLASAGACRCAQRPIGRRRAARCGAGQIHPELRAAQWRAGAAAAVVGVHGHHSAADQDGARHWPGPRRGAGPGHIKEFIAAAGVGMASQYVEQFGRKLLGGLLGKVAGKTLGNIGRAATGMAFSFATTYALGQVAKRYYAGGRVMSTAMLRESFQDMLGPAKQLQTEYLPQIRQKAATLDAGQIMSMVRGA